MYFHISFKIIFYIKNKDNGLVEYAITQNDFDTVKNDNNCLSFVEKKYLGKTQAFFIIIIRFLFFFIT